MQKINTENEIITVSYIKNSHSVRILGRWEFSTLISYAFLTHGINFVTYGDNFENSHWIN